MTDDTDLLAQTGELLAGEYWLGPLALDLGMGERNLRYWRQGRHGIPGGVWADLAKIVRKRIAALEKHAAVLDRRAARAAADG